MLKQNDILISICIPLVNKITLQKSLRHAKLNGNVVVSICVEYLFLVKEIWKEIKLF